MPLHTHPPTPGPAGFTDTETPSTYQPLVHTATPQPGQPQLNTAQTHPSAAPFSPTHSDPPHTATGLLGHLPRHFIRHQALHLLITIIADVIIPVVLYFILNKFIDPWIALLIGSVPALLIVIVKGVWKRTVDIVALTVFVAFAISAIVAVATRNGRILIFEKSVVTFILGIVFFISLIPFTIPRFWSKDKTPLQVKPLVLIVGKQLLPLGDMNKQTTGGVEITRWDWMYDTIPRFRRECRILTAVWAFGLIAEFLGRMGMYLSVLTLDQVVLYANVYFGVILGILVIITIVYMFWVRKKVLSGVEAWLENEGWKDGAGGVNVEMEESAISGGPIMEAGKAQQPAEGEGRELVEQWGEEQSMERV